MTTDHDLVEKLQQNFIKQSSTLVDCGNSTVKQTTTFEDIAPQHKCKVFLYKLHSEHISDSSSGLLSSLTVQYQFCY